MENCLVTKLKASVNNPDLPIFEPMAQFTLDAITASSNSVMTDGQKVALNHFFYKIGAVSNSALWNKIVNLSLPVICNDNALTALVNYVDNTNYTNSQDIAFDTHGVVGDFTTFDFIGNTESICMLNL